MKITIPISVTMMLAAWSILPVAEALGDPAVNPDSSLDFSLEYSSPETGPALAGMSAGRSHLSLDRWGYETSLFRREYLDRQDPDPMSSRIYAMAQETLNEQFADAETGGAAGGGAPKDDAAAIAAAMLNPLSYLWLMFAQNDTIHYEGDSLDALGEDDVNQNITLLMPVFSQQLTENWKLIFRPVIPILSVETLGNVDVSINNVGSVTGIDVQRETGVGDIVLWTAFSKSYTPPNIFGFGTTVMLDTASDEMLGSGKFAAGPMALYVKITEKWVLGAVAQHWWSFAGDDKISINTNLGQVKVERPDVNLTDIQPIIRYRYSPMTNIGMAPNWRYNHETDQLDLPIGIGFDTMVKIGPLPAKIGCELYYFLEQSDDFGPKWQFRFLFVPVLPAPASSRDPWF